MLIIARWENWEPWPHCYPASLSPAGVSFGRSHPKATEQGRLVMESKEVGLQEYRAGRNRVEGRSGKRVWSESENMHHNKYCCLVQPSVERSGVCLLRIKMCFIHTVEYYWIIKRNKIGSFVERWMGLESVIQSEISQRGKLVLHINAYMWNLEKWYWWTCLQGRDRDEGLRMVMWTEQGREGWDELED